MYLSLYIHLYICIHIYIYIYIYTGKPPPGNRNQRFLGRLMRWFAWELTNWFAAKLLDQFAWALVKGISASGKYKPYSMLTLFDMLCNSPCSK